MDCDSELDLMLQAAREYYDMGLCLLPVDAKRKGTKGNPLEVISNQTPLMVDRQKLGCEGVSACHRYG